jgi:hypothetical protein
MDDAHRQRRDALKHRNGFVASSSARSSSGSARDGEEEHAGVSGGDAVMNNAFVNVNNGGVYYQRQHRGGERRRTTTTTKASVAKTKSKAKTWFYRYLQIAVIVFLITCSIAFAEFIYERMLFEHSEIKEHPHGKTLFVGAAVAVVACWTMLVVVVVLSY